MNEKQRSWGYHLFELEFYITFITHLCSGDALHISSQELLKLGLPAQSSTSQWHRDSLLWTIWLVVLQLPWSVWPHLHNAVLTWHKWFLWYISVKKMKWDQIMRKWMPDNCIPMVVPCIWKTTALPILLLAWKVGWSTTVQKPHTLPAIKSYILK